MTEPRSQVRPAASRVVFAASVVSAALFAGVSGGCQGPGRDFGMARTIQQGEYGAARARAAAELKDESKYRVKRLDQFIALCNADGIPEAAEAASAECFALLRAQGANRGGSESIGGGNLWKGEPFEQAMTFSNIAVQRAMSGEWDNARAAAGESLFRLRDFRDSQERSRGQVLDKEELAERAARRPKGGSEDWLDHGYVDTKTDFALGYLLAGCANLALGRDDEASDQFKEAATINPNLADAGQALLRGQANTVLLVEYGEGPRKLGVGRYQSIATFRPLTSSDPRALDARVGGAGGSGFLGPVACDLNIMSRDHRWQALDDVRTARGVIGDTLIAAGATSAVVGSAVGRGRGGNAAVLAGLGAIVAGLATRETAKADETYDEGLPQRVYFVPVLITSPGTTVELTFPSGERIALPGLDPPKGWSPPATGSTSDAGSATSQAGLGNIGGGRLNLRLFRMPANLGSGASWLRNSTPRYAIDVPPPAGPSVSGDDLPFLLGGTCVRKPSPEVLAYYHSRGRLLTYSLNDLENLYRAEGISLDGSGEAGAALRGDPGATRHILEGGQSIRAPLAGTAGYLRLLCRDHPPYRPRSKDVQGAIESLNRK